MMPYAVRTTIPISIMDYKTTNTNLLYAASDDVIVIDTVVPAE